MKDHVDEFDRLVTRILDDEGFATDRAELNQRIRTNSQEHARYEEYVALDRELGAALRGDFRRAARPRRLMFRIMQAGSLAAAACLAVALMWQQPRALVQPEQRMPDGRPIAVGTMFGGGAAPAADVMTSADPGYDRPRLNVRDTSREWLLIPGKKPGEFLLIQADRVKNHRVNVQEDY